ncbi:type II toxin-antitoxin system VapC family toxin [Psychrobacter sp. I-STPA10]|uniref:type II toxin-antitoxin system VapC family toxin n=1 Tax=Psychrobacter sp. I-STPA10 TaxID=2585769 RepID=UPI001E613F52|nr:type II toxin-antitoxin system VapC family toxin [Psychrobacter sp. I-STPA10]
MKYVLDTNTLIYFFKGMGQVASYIYNCHPQDIAIPAIVLYELYVGIEKSTHPNKRITQLETLLTQVQVLPFNQQEAKISAMIRAQLEQNGTPIGHYDIQIAGTTLTHNAILVTHNTKEFSRVEGLQIIDWF